MLPETRTADLADRSQRPSFRPWRELAAFTFLVMEASWVALWYRGLPVPGMNIPYARALLGLGGMLISAYLLAFFVSALKRSFWVQRTLYGACLIASLAFGKIYLLLPHDPVPLTGFFSQPLRSVGSLFELVPPEFVLAVVVLLLWWRGSDLAGENLEPVIVLSGFRTGVVMLLVYGLFLWQRAEPVGLAVYLFLWAGLLSLSASRIALLSRLRGGRVTPFSRQWFTGVMAGGLAVVGLAALAVLVVQEYLAGQLGPALLFVRDVLTFIAVLVIIPPLALILDLLLRGGEYLRIGAVMSRISEVVQKLLQFLESLFGPELAETGIAIPYLRQIILMVGLLLLFLLVVLGWQIRFRKAQRQLEDDFESILGEGEAFGDWRAALQRRAQVLARRLQGWLRINRAARLWSTYRIRRIYIQLLNLAEKLEHPRGRAQTPLEYLPTLEQTLPGLSEELKTITNAYLRVRYGELPETAAEIDLVEQAWQRISSQGKTQLAARRV